MFEYRERNREDKEWIEMLFLGPTSSVLWESYDHRIDGVVYINPSKEFDEAFERERIWSKLQGD